MRRSVRLSAILVLLGVTAVLLSACSGINRPFAREKSWLGSRDPQAPPVIITEMEGVPEATAERLAGQMYTESRRRGFTTNVEEDAGDGFVVTGTMIATPTDAGTTVVYVWDVWDPSRKHQHRISGRETIAGTAYADPWIAVDDSAMQRIASQTSEQLAGFISQMGYEVRMASVPPPAEMLSDAADSITTAAITGSLYASPEENLGLTESYSAASDDILLRSAQPAADDVLRTSGQSEAASSSAQQDSAGERVSDNRNAASSDAGESRVMARPTAIAVPPVVGASNSGNSELATAMRQAMARVGLPIVNERRDGALTVVGEVTLEAPQGGQQTVKLNWRVIDQDGSLIGTIAQSNQVPSGSLDDSWGQAARYAAEAAAGGIFELLAGG